MMIHYNIYYLPAGWIIVELVARPSVVGSEVPSVTFPSVGEEHSEIEGAALGHVR